MGFHKSNSKHFHNGWSGSLMMTVRGAGAGRDWGKRGVVRLCVCVYTCACVDAGESEICSGVVMYFCNVSYLVLWALHMHSHRGIWSIRNALITAVWSPLLLPCLFSLRLFPFEFTICFQVLYEHGFTALTFFIALLLGFLLVVLGVFLYLVICSRRKRSVSPAKYDVGTSGIIRTAGHSVWTLCWVSYYSQQLIESSGRQMNWLSEVPRHKMF